MSAVVELSEHSYTDIYKLPNPKTMLKAVQKSIAEDKPIKMEYFTNSLFTGECSIVKSKDGNTVLYKSDDDYTSPIIGIDSIQFDNANAKNKVEVELLLETHNSIYIVHQNIDPEVFKGRVDYTEIMKF